MSATSLPASSAPPAVLLFRLPPKYVVGLALCVLLALLSVGLLIRYQYQGSIEEWKNRLSSIADGEELYINSWVFERNGDLAVLSARPALASTLLPNLREAERQRGVAEALPLIDRVVVAYDYTAIYMVDRAGVIRVSSTGAPALPRALIETAPDFAQSKFEVLSDDLARQFGARILLTKPVWAGVPHADFKEGQGGVLGRVFVLSRASLIYSLPSLGTTSTRTGESVLIRREGDGPVFLSSLRHLMSIPPERRSSLRPSPFAGSSILEGRAGFEQVEDYRGVRVLEVTRLIPGVGWGLITKIDRAEALENFYSLAGLELAVAAIVLFVLVAISFKSAHDRQIQGLQEEITRREQAEEQLRLSHEQLGFALKAGQSGTFEWDVQNDVNTWSPEIEGVYGLPPGEFNAKGRYQDWLDLVLSEDHAVAKAAIEQSLKTGEFAGEWRICRRSDGQIRWVLGRGKVIFDETGLPVRMFGINADITALKHTEEDLRLSEERFSSAFEYAPIGLALVSLTGRWIKVNKSLCDLVGYSAEELHTKTFQDITHPDDLEVDLEYVRRMLAGEIYSYRMEKRYFRKSGRIVWISLSVSLVRDNKRQPLHFITQVEDITARKTAEEAIRRLNEELEQRVAQRTAELQASNQELESFSYSVSHDLRAPLRSINGFSRILMEEYAPQLISEAQRYLQVIQKNAIRMGDLIDDLLAFSRLGLRA
jgi:PAS domain S-box-containing protein